MKLVIRSVVLSLLTFSFLIADEKKKALVEYMGSTQCPYCPQVTVLLDRYQDPSHADYFGKDIVDDMVVVRYHTYNPGYGDPMYATIGGKTCDTDFTCVRINGEVNQEWYKISGVPAVFIDGQQTSNYLDEVKTTQAETTPVKISLDGSSFDDLTVNIKVTITSGTDLSSDPLYLFVMATIDSVTYAGANGETHHDQVFLGFIGDTGPGGLGKAITLKKDEAIEWTDTWTMKSDYPNEAHGRDLGLISDWNTTVWDKKNMNLVAFVQNKTTLEVVQAEMISRRTMPTSQAPVLTAISDVTIDEDGTTDVTLSATDPDNDPITYSAESDTNAVTTTISSTKLTLTPNANWNGVANISVYASDGVAKDTTTFKLTVTPIPDPPGAFAWTDPTSEYDSISVTNSNGGDKFKIAWDESTDPDGDVVTYKLIVTHPPSSAIGIKGESISSTSREFTYAELIGIWPSNFFTINRLNYKFDIYAYSSNDSVQITGTRQLLVKKEGNLNTESIGIPKSFVLHPNYPNPFNPQTQIKFEIPYASNVDLSVYNILGVKVKTLYSGQKPPGTFVFKWDGKNENDELVSGGVYIYQLKTEKDIQMRKMILLK